MKTIVDLLVASLAALLLAACATPPSGRITDRLSAEAQAPTKPVVPKLSLEDVKRLTAEGLSSEAIIARLRETASRHRLSATDVLSLRTAGVPLAVIDHLLDSERQAVLDECSEQINRRESEAAVALQQAEQLCWMRCNLSCPPFGMFPYPYFPGRR